MIDNIDTEWISLHDASALLGVAPSTVRRWGDDGRLPTRRTLGGHRRFLRVAVEQLRRELQPPPAVADVTATRHWSVDHAELMRQDWHTRFGGHASTDRMRSLGQRLLGMLMQYINAPSSSERLLHEARDVGTIYGQEASQLNVSLLETIEAFLYFRRAFAALARPNPAATPPDSAEIARLRGRLDQFMDEILLGTIAGFEQGRQAALEATQAAGGPACK